MPACRPIENGHPNRTGIFCPRPWASTYSTSSVNHAAPLMNGRICASTPPSLPESYPQDVQSALPQPGITTPLYVIVSTPSLNVPETMPVDGANERVRPFAFVPALIAFVFVFAV